MPKNYTKEELENGRWVTMKGTRVFIKDGETPQEAIDRALGKTVEKKNRYKDMDVRHMQDELEKKTGIRAEVTFLNDVNKDTFAEVCNTLEDLDSKYKINNLVSNSFGSEYKFIAKVVTESYVDSRFERDNIFAQADMFTLEMNPKYYKLTPEELDSVYEPGVEDGYHPRGTTSKNIIAHETAHIMLNCKAWKLCDKDWNKYVKVSHFLTESAEYNGVGETTLPEIKSLFNKFNKVRKKHIAYLKKDEEAVKYLGSYLNDNCELREMANPKLFGYRYSISEYSAKNYHELVAESFADFYANGNKAKVLSRMVCYDILGIKEAKI